MKHEVLVIGRGGQGILLFGRVLGVAAAKYAQLHVSATESYGSETRGTESRVDMIISDKLEEIDYIKVRKATIFLVMYPFNLEKYMDMISDNACIFLNATYIEDFPEKPDWKIHRAPYTEIAEKETGTIRTANIVALGHVVGKTGIVKPEHVIDAIREIVPSKWLELNIKAFNVGLNLP
ncbi:MAG: 2-oxoglutarate oxidoreductase [Desulfurococcales archaeon ex4484_58]|nr:MAG: 2-oxoglutarate oxidoreductase [Desulfurococcales archaeon ex4484_58]